MACDERCDVRRASFHGSCSTYYGSSSQVLSRRNAVVPGSCPEPPFPHQKLYPRSIPAILCTVPRRGGIVCVYPASNSQDLKYLAHISYEKKKQKPGSEQRKSGPPRNSKNAQNSRRRKDCTRDQSENKPTEIRPLHFRDAVFAMDKTAKSTVTVQNLRQKNLSVFLSGITHSPSSEDTARRKRDSDAVASASAPVKVMSEMQIQQILCTAFCSPPKTARSPGARYTVTRRGFYSGSTSVR